MSSASRALPLYVRTVEIADPGPLSEQLSEPNSLAWIRRGDGLVGLGEVVRHKATTIEDAQQWWDEVRSSVIVDPTGSAEQQFGSGLVAFGSFVFDPDNTADQSVMIVPQTVIGRRDGRAWRTEISSDPIPATQPGDSAPAVPAGSPDPFGPVAYRVGALDAEAWTSAVAEALGRIGTGALEKVVLARDLSVIAERPIDARRLVGWLSREYQACWTYHVDGFVGSTPEMLIRQQARLATSRVLAGTIRRTDGGEHDLALAASLAQSSKDLEEHEYAVASVARALAPYCSGMHVPDAPYVLELPNVLHLATDVTAVADHGAGSLTLAAALHPSAAVCGTPTSAARETIAELERMDRGRYAGPVGWIDANGDGEWAIGLRGGQIDPDDERRIRIFAGCGIVAGSDPAEELAEADAKFAPMRAALQH